MKNFKNYNLFNVLIFNLFFCFYAFSQDINNPDQYAKDVNERIEKSSRKELRLKLNPPGSGPIFDELVDSISSWMNEDGSSYSFNSFLKSNDILPYFLINIETS